MSTLDGHVVLVTGGTDGIGRAAVRRFASRGASVVFTGRDERKADRTLTEVTDVHPAGEGTVVLTDFADFDAVSELARSVRERFDRLDVLVNNAGTWQSSRRLTDDGVEYTVAVNHFAPFLLTNLLAPLLTDSAPARVVTVSSGMHSRGRVDVESFATQPDFGGQQAYANSKLANVLFSNALARRLEATGVTSNALHPGTIPATSLARDTTGLSKYVRKAMRFLPVTSTPEDGAGVIEYVATSPELEGVTGNYFVDHRQATPARRARDEALQDALWELSTDVTDLPENVPAVDPLAPRN